MNVPKTLVALLAITLLTTIFVSCDRTITRIEQTVEPQNCFDCHSDQNTFLVSAEQQWRNSIHASGRNVNRGTSGSCAGCHSGDGFIQRTNGEEVTGSPNPGTIHCFTCHQPHTEGDFGLRWATSAELMNGTTFDLGSGNICAACHQARRNVDTYVGSTGAATTEISSTHWGPHHSNQADMLIGSNGYEYEGYAYEISEHRTALDNGCADCHMLLGTRNNVVGGHSWNMRATRIDLDGELEEFVNTAACEGCHGDVDDFNVNGAQDGIDALVLELDELLEATGLWHDGHPVAGVTTSVDSAGAVWNLLFVVEDRSRGVHNAKYARGLLESAIDFMEGNLPASNPDVRVTLGESRPVTLER